MKSKRKRLLNGVYNFVIVSIGIYIVMFVIILLLGIMELLINWFITGQINIEGHNGLAINSEVGYTCYAGDSNCYAPINYNMFWMILSPALVRMVFSIGLIFFIGGLAGIDLKVHEEE